MPEIHKDIPSGTRVRLASGEEYGVVGSYRDELRYVLSMGDGITQQSTAMWWEIETIDGIDRDIWEQRQIKSRKNR